MKKIILFCLIFTWCFGVKAQENNTVQEKSFRFMFYNVENLFDTEDDPEKDDNEFLPGGAKYWNKYRYEDKLFHIYQVVTAVGEWNAPEIIGLCEVENRKVLEDLIAKTPLTNAGYKIIHYESPDNRGIDVAFLYREKYFKPLEHYPIRVFDASWTRPTRDILYVKGLTSTGDTLHTFINHWPSRWGGQLETEPKRMFAASVLRHNVDSLFKIYNNPNILIAGDLNDYPENKSVTNVLKAQHNNYHTPENESLYNLSYYLQEEKRQGSHKFHGEWGVLDQIIVSGNLLDTSANFHTSLNHVSVFNAEFLLEDDDAYTGKQVFRTYIGFKYHGGYSDHLPVYIDFMSHK